MALGYIEGTVQNKSENKVILLTASGLGYEIFCARDFPIKSNIALYLTAIYRENSQDLFGFSTFEEKLFYELLLNVKGIGPKSAFALINNLGAPQVQTAILQSDKKLLQSAPGIGAKAAAQIVLDLGNKIQNWMLLNDPNASKRQLLEGDNLPPNTLIEEALTACKELGFKESKVRPLISQIVADKKFSKAEDLVESVLRNI